MSAFSESWNRLRARAGEPGHSADGDDSTLDLAKVLGALKLKNVSTLKDVAAESLTKEPLDDRVYMMERIVDLATELPTNSVTSQSLTNSFLSKLWADLQHPPKSYLGSDYVFRKADGSNNNFMWPHVGKAGQPYARSVKAINRQPVARPDPGVIFDSVLKRKAFKEHPNKLSSVLFYVASIIIHDCFHTNHDDFNISDTSSYLDLSPLYGNNEIEQRSVRIMKDGKLKPDCFADTRILGFPPGVGAILIFFNRFHNDVVEKLAQIDENGRFSRILHHNREETNGESANGGSQPSDPLALYDEALFQTARLVTSGLYINIILKDYVRTILNLNRVDSDWNLDPRSSEGKALFGAKIPEATGNQVSAEFNLVYRWHACISERDEKWTQDIYDKIFPGASKRKPLSMKDFLGALKEWSGRLLNQSPESREFAGLRRGDDGRFDDNDLAEIWTQSVADVAGAFGASNVPEVLKPVEILGIIQARSWNLASLNELRQYFKLKPWTSFQDMNPDPEIAHQLELLYEHPDNVEMYPGVILEAAKKPLDPGSGLCTNFTISRAILSDAVGLVRGDRFYTVDYTTSNLTNFGYSMADFDININHGCVFYKLILTALPNNYLKNSIYAHYPMTIPSESEKILTALDRAHIYDFSTPYALPRSVPLTSHLGCEAVFESAARVRRLPRIQTLNASGGHGDRVKGSPLVLSAMREYLESKPSAVYVRQFFEKITLKLISQHSHKLAGAQRVDIIRDVVNPSQVHFVACLFALPLKTEDNVNGKFTAQELWAALIAIYSSTHERRDPADSFRAQQSAESALLQIGTIMEDTLKSFDSRKHGIIASIIDRLHDQESGDITDQSAHFLQTMLRLGIPTTQLIYQYLLPIAANICILQARAFADCLDFFLDASNGRLQELRRLSLHDTASADARIEQLALEALRENSDLKTYARVSSIVSVQEKGKRLDISPGEIAEYDWARTHANATTSENRHSSRSKMPTTDYLPGLPGFSPEYPGLYLGRSAIVGMLKIFGRLDEVRRFPGAQGRMKTMRGPDGSKLYLEVDEEAAHTYPSAMKINYQ